MKSAICFCGYLTFVGYINVWVAHSEKTKGIPFAQPPTYAILRVMVREKAQQPKADVPQLFQEGPALSEINLLRFPLTLLFRPNTQSAKELVEQMSIRYVALEEPGSERVWEVNPHQRYGVLTAVDKKVIVTVQKLVTEDGFPPQMLYRLGSLKRLCRTMQLGVTGPNIERIRDSLIRISATNIYTELFYLKDDDEYWGGAVNRKQGTGQAGGSFALWNVFWRNDPLPTGEKADCIYLQFNAPFILSLQAFYVKPIDYNFWLSLSPLAQRIYELSGLKFYGQKNSPYITYEYPQLCSLMPIKAQQYLSDAKRILKRAHRQLEDADWFDNVEWVVPDKQRSFNSDRPWVLRYYPGPRAKAEVAQAKERLHKFQQKQLRENSVDDWHYVRGWTLQLGEILEDSTGRNTGFYTKIAKLVVSGKIDDSLVWEAAHTAKVEDHEGNISENRSAFFTDYLKRRLNERNKDLNTLLKEV